MKSLVVGTVGSRLMWIKLLDGLWRLTLRLRRRKIIKSNKDIDEFYELVEESIDRDRW